jgi:hypothetical protein
MIRKMHGTTIQKPVLCNCERSASLYNPGKGIPGTPWIRCWVNPKPSTSSGGRKNVLVPAGNNPFTSFLPPAVWHYRGADKSLALPGREQAISMSKSS